MPFLWLLIAPYEVNILREGALASSSHPRMFLRAHSPTSGARLCNYHMMGILQQSHTRITWMIDPILFLWEKECGMLSRLSFPNVKTIKNNNSARNNNNKKN